MTLLCNRLGWVVAAAIVITLPTAAAAAFVAHHATNRNHHHQQQPKQQINMVRNIDLPEAVIFYGSPVVMDGDDWRSGWPDLVAECDADQTASVILWDNDPTDNDDLPDGLATWCRHHAITNTNNHALHHVFPQTVRPPNPRDLLRALERVTVQPRAFGGSSGFGQQQHADPARSPLPARTVVLSHTADQTRAARSAGMRVIRLLLHATEAADSDDDDPLADFCLDDGVIDVTIDDISTPGSFWLNPPHPRDDEGNRVDPVALAEADDDDSNDVNNNNNNNNNEPSEEDLLRMLADIDPL